MSKPFGPPPPPRARPFPHALPFSLAYTHGESHTPTPTRARTHARTCARTHRAHVSHLPPPPQYQPSSISVLRIFNFAQESEVLRAAYIELYRRLLLLKNFAATNFSALYEITRKFDNVTGVCILAGVLLRARSAGSLLTFFQTKFILCLVHG